MMPEYDDKNRFVLFRNTKRREGKNDPHFTGTFTDEHGREYWASAWSKEPKNGGDKFLSGDMRLKEAKSAPRSAPQQREMVDDEIPF
jgi:hypothetical protein